MMARKASKKMETSTEQRYEGTQAREHVKHLGTQAREGRRSQKHTREVIQRILIKAGHGGMLSADSNVIF